MKSRRAKSRLPRAIKEALRAQEQAQTPTPVVPPPMQPLPPILDRPPEVRQAPKLLPASTTSPGDTEAVVPYRSRASLSPDRLLQTMGEQVLVGQRVEGACEFWIQLKEEILGGVQIRLSLAGGFVSATLIAADPGTQRLLEERLPQLDRQLRKRGMKVASIDVICS